MSADNYRLSIATDPVIKYDADTVMPYFKTTFELKLLLDPQHDGHLWSECDVTNEEDDLIHDILNDLREQLIPLVRNTKVFGIHGPK